MIQLCRHILPGGKICDQASVKDTLFCRHHSTVRASIEREQAAPAPEIEHTPIAFVYPEDRAAIQLNFFLVLKALTDRRIDNRTANTMNRLLRSCEQNLRAGALSEVHIDKVAQRIVTLPEGEEVGLPREALEATDPPEESHGSGCPCPQCEPRVSALPNERHHAACQCGACLPTEDAAIREATALEMHNFLPEPYVPATPPDIDLETERNTGLGAGLEGGRSAEQNTAHHAESSVAGSGYVENWSRGMSAAMLEHFTQARTEGRMYDPQSIAASGV